MKHTIRLNISLATSSSGDSKMQGAVGEPVNLYRIHINVLIIFTRVPHSTVYRLSISGRLTQVFEF